ncbi:MAG: hypothetical protein ACLRIS_10120 [Flavonifractor plautii]
MACLLLAIFSAFGYFHIQAIFIDFFCGLVKGLIGYGYWLLPPCCWWPAGSWSSTGAARTAAGVVRPAHPSAGGLPAPP